jgi:hypothetical protein
MNRAVAVNAASIEAVNAAHANVIHDKKERRDTGVLAAGAAFGGAGLGGAVATVEGAGEFSLLIGISQKDL